MEKLFKRNDRYTQVLTEEAETYFRKKEKKAFLRYVYTHIGKDYKEIIQSCFPKIEEKGYLEFIFDLNSQLENLHPGNNTSEEDLESQRWKLIQVLAVAIEKPKLIFDSSSQIKYKFVCEFEDILQEVYQKWRDFSEELALCQHYFQRATTRLDRPDEKDNFSDQREEIANEIDSIYQAYYYQLLAIGLKKARLPTARRQSNLFINITERPWLVPLAHVILIRDAQYQMIGKEKYKDAELLQGKPVPLNIEADQLKNYALLTVLYAERIRDILAKHLIKRQKTNCRVAFSRYFKKEFERKERELSPFQDIGIYNIKASFKARKEYQARISFFDVPDFSVPNCYVTETALMIAKQLEFTPDQFMKLKGVMPAALWEQQALKKTLKEFDEETQEKLVEIIDPLRTLVNAKEYFSGNRTDSDISDKLLKAAERICPRNAGTTSKNNMEEKMAQAWKVYKKMIYFQDLTRSALFLSGAADPHTAPDNICFPLFSSIRSKLHKNLKKYYSRSYLASSLGIIDVSKKMLRESAFITPNDDLREKLMNHIAKVNSESELTVAQAEQVLKRIDKFKRSTQKSAQTKRPIWEVDIDEVAKSCKSIKQIDQKSQQHLCLHVYLSLSRRAAGIIEEHIIGNLFSNALRFYQNMNIYQQGRPMDKEKFL